MKASPPLSPAIDSLRLGFVEESGLWRIDQAGHTRPVAALAAVHSGVLTAARLAMAAQMGVLDEFPVERSLRALRALQCVDGSDLHGCLKWYAEEPAPVDTNAAFFTGLNLIVLSARYRGELPAGATEPLDEMLADLLVWFRKECATKAAYYPNKFLGDLVCAWLLREQLEPASEPAKELADILHASADYWLNRHWGWGEHLSDLYAAVMLNELSVLLLFARKLPPDLRGKYLSLFEELLAVEDAYGGGPRVPAIRTYAFGGPPARQSFRDGIVSWEDREVLPSGMIEFLQFGHLFHEMGWEKLAGPPRPMAEQVEIACFDGVVAKAWIAPAWRMGTLSRFPFMPNSDNARWGLSWQTMPAVFATGSDGWGFLRWQAREDGVDRFHPARDKISAYLKNALTDVVAPPIVGQSHSLQEGADALILRRMPAISRHWERLADQLVLTGETLVVEEEESGETVSRLLLRAKETLFTVFFFPLRSHAALHLRREGTETIWEAVWSADDLRDRERVTCAWLICGGRHVAGLEPAFAVGTGEFHIRQEGDEKWMLPWPGIARKGSVAIDPLASEPLAFAAKK